MLRNHSTDIIDDVYIEIAQLLSQLICFQLQAIKYDT